MYNVLIVDIFKARHQAGYEELYDSELLSIFTYSFAPLRIVYFCICDTLNHLQRGNP